MASVFTSRTFSRSLTFRNCVGACDEGCAEHSSSSVLYRRSPLICSGSCCLQPRILPSRISTLLPFCLQAPPSGIQVLPCYVIHFHPERVRGFMYHDLSAAGALVKVQGNHPPAAAEAAAEAAARQAAKDEEALAGEMAARKRAEFYFGKRFRVREWFVSNSRQEQFWARINCKLGKRF